MYGPMKMISGTDQRDMGSDLRGTRGTWGLDSGTNQRDMGSGLRDRGAWGPAGWFKESGFIKSHCSQSSGSAGEQRGS